VVVVAAGAFADAPAADFTVYLWGMPGSGRSSNANHPVDFGVQAEALAALLECWELQRPHIIAHDIGGVVSLPAHLWHQAPYASMLLADVVAIPPAGSPFWRYVQQHAEVPADVGRRNIVSGAPVVSMQMHETQEARCSSASSASAT